MNIGFDAKRVFQNYTGLGNYGRTLLRNLILFYPKQNYYLYAPYLRRNRETEDFFVNTNFKIRNSLSFFKSYWRSFSIKNDLRKDKIDLYHGLSNEIPTGLKNTTIKSVVTIHDLIFKIVPETYPSIDRRIYDLKFKYACRNADLIIAISESTKKDIIRFYHIDPQKIAVVYQPVNPIFYSGQITGQVNEVIAELRLPEDFILYVGSISQRKNLKMLLNAYALMNNSSQIPMVIVGKGGQYKKECIELAFKLGISKKLHWIDSVYDNRHIQALLQKAQLVVYPSLYEGFGLPVVEALLSETPVITSRVSSMPEAVGNDHLLADPKNPEEWMHLMDKVITDNDFRISALNQSVNYVKKTFDPQKLIHQMMELYEKVLSV
ncbi:MAG: glycosyltransferase family 4 protein [Bacteroidales bacterium]